MPASKNEFRVPESYDHEIYSKGDSDRKGGKLGDIRVKPSSILWKRKSAHQYKSVSLEDFVAWIEKNGKDAAK